MRTSPVRRPLILLDGERLDQILVPLGPPARHRWRRQTAFLPQGRVEQTPFSTGATVTLPVLVRAQSFVGVGVIEAATQLHVDGPEQGQGLAIQPAAVHVDCCADSQDKIAVSGVLSRKMEVDTGGHSFITGTSGQSAWRPFGDYPLAFCDARGTLVRDRHRHIVKRFLLIAYDFINL